MSFRIGIGYDVHALIPGNEIVLGGVKIPHTLTTRAHSDGDVLLHALCDAMLGAAAMGDIGKHFPDTEPAYKGISSLILLEKVHALLKQSGYVVANVDITVIAEKPKISEYSSNIVRNIANILKIETSQVSVKATTNEKIGFIGRNEGIAAIAVALIQSVV